MQPLDLVPERPILHRVMTTCTGPSGKSNLYDTIMNRSLKEMAIQGASAQEQLERVSQAKVTKRHLLWPQFSSKKIQKIAETTLRETQQPKGL